MTLEKKATMENLPDLSEKEKFHLRIDFLKLSEPYRDYCDCYRKWEKLKKSKKAFAPYEPVSYCDAPMMFINDKTATCDNKRIMSTFERFGDIHHPKYDFEEHWISYQKDVVEYNKKKSPKFLGYWVCEQCGHKFTPPEKLPYKEGLKCPKCKSSYWEEFRPIQLLQDKSSSCSGESWLDVYFRMALRNLKGLKVDHSDPTVKEFIDYFITKLPEISRGFLFMRVDIHKDDEILIKQFKNLIRAGREKNLRPKALTLDRYYECIPKAIRADELKRYLEVYKLKKEQKLSKQFIENLSCEYNIILEPEKDFGKAERIIKYAEYGIFPGPYEKNVKIKEIKSNGPSCGWPRRHLED